MDSRGPANERKSVSLLVKLAEVGSDEFVEKFATNLSSGGMFIWSRDARADGTVLQVRVEIAGGERLLQGTAVVRWSRAPKDPGGPPGWGLEFTGLDPASAALIDRLLAPAPIPAAAPPEAGAGGGPNRGDTLPELAPVPESSPQTTAPLPSLAPGASVFPGGLVELSGEEAAQFAAEPTGRFDVGAAISIELSGEEAAQFAAEPTSRVNLASLSRSTIELSGEEAAQVEAEPTRKVALASVFPPEAEAEESAAPEPPGAGSPPTDPPLAASPAPQSPPPSLEVAAAPSAPSPVVPPPWPGPAEEAPPSVVVSPELFAPVPVAPPPPSPGLPRPSPKLLAPTPPRGTPAVATRSPAQSAAPMKAVDIDIRTLVQITPAPPLETTNIFIDPSLTAPVAPGPPTSPPTRRTTREMAIALPIGKLKPAPVRRSRAVDELAYLGRPPPFVPDSPLVGIDLGTTNSCCAVLSGGKPVVLKTKDGLNVIPSLVAINKLSKMVVGEFAHAEMLLNPAQCIYGSKRLVGRDFASPAVGAVRERFAYEIVENPDGKAAVKLGGKRVSLEEVQAIVLNECRLLAEAFLSKRVSRAVITCPAYFTEPQRQSIRTAGALAGLRVERILNEPTAAALAYGMNHDLSRRVLVYDVGGGTFDATLLRIEKNVFEVLATGGDVFLGGLDFDNQLIQSLLKKFEAQHKVTFGADPGALARVADQAEKAKIALSEKLSVEVQLPMLQLAPNGTPLGLRCTLTRKELEDACAPLVERTLEVVSELLADAGLKPSEIDEVVLVGGMSRMPMVRERLKGMFKKPPHASVNAEEAVAVGAALYTGVVDKVSNVVLIDVAPMTLGIGLPGGGYKRLIPRNTPLPASASIGFATTEDMSDALEVSVFQGEDADVSVNDYVGTVRVDGLPRAPRGLVKVAISLKLDADCVLHVEAREMHTRRLYSSTLATRYTTREVQQRLGIQPQSAKEAVSRRTEELKNRGGRFWGLLRQIVKWRR